MSQKLQMSTKIRTSTNRVIIIDIRNSTKTTDTVTIVNVLHVNTNQQIMHNSTYVDVH